MTWTCTLLRDGNLVPHEDLPARMKKVLAHAFLGDPLPDQASAEEIKHILEPMLEDGMELKVAGNTE